MTTSRPQDQRASRLFWGVLLVSAGLLLLLDPALDFIHVSVGRLWPLLLVVLGFAKMTGSRPRPHGGLWLMIVGLWLLLNTLSDWEYRETWPLLVVFMGMRMIWTSFGGRRELYGRTEKSHVG
jgi:uncharacterized membrane protein HdeD (DUF308 family)